MKIKVNGNQIERENLGDVLHSLTHKTMFYSGGHLQATWCRCSKCNESIELNFPESALSFVGIHERDCGNDIEIEITTSREVVRAW